MDCSTLSGRTCSQAVNPLSTKPGRTSTAARPGRQTVKKHEQCRKLLFHLGLRLGEAGETERRSGFWTCIGEAGDSARGKLREGTARKACPHNMLGAAAKLFSPFCLQMERHLLNYLHPAFLPAMVSFSVARGGELCALRPHSNLPVNPCSSYWSLVCCLKAF